MHQTAERPQSKLKRLRLLLAVGTVAVCVVASVNALSLSLAVDRCLDSGGRWDKVAEACER